MSERNAPAFDRRRFLQLAGLAGLGVGTHAFAADTPAGSPSSPPPPAVNPAPPSDEKPPSEDALAITGVLRRRYASALSEAQWTLVARDVDGDLAAGKRLREWRFQNGDEPDSVFEP